MGKQEVTVEVAGGSSGQGIHPFCQRRRSCRESWKTSLEGQRGECECVPFMLWGWGGGAPLILWAFQAVSPLKL